MRNFRKDKISIALYEEMPQKCISPNIKKKKSNELRMLNKSKTSHGTKHNNKTNNKTQ